MDTDNKSYDTFFEDEEEKERFRGNIKILVADEDPSFKHFLKLIFLSDLKCQEKNLVFVSN